MSVFDVFEPPPKVADMLVDMFQRQEKLEEVYSQIEASNGFIFPDAPVDIDDYQGQAKLKHKVFCMVQEMFEATNTLKNKPWKSTPVVTDKAHFYKEIGDTFHFFISFCLDVGIGPEELYAIYYQTSKINESRQKDNY